MTGTASVDAVAVVIEADIREDVAIPVPLTGGAILTPVVNRPVILLGIVLEAAGAAAVVTCFNGEAASGILAAALSVAASGADTEWFGPGGIYCPSGISAAVTGSPTAASLLVKYVRK